MYKILQISKMHNSHLLYKNSIKKYPINLCKINDQNTTHQKHDKKIFHIIIYVQNNQKATKSSFVHTKQKQKT